MGSNPITPTISFFRPPLRKRAPRPFARTRGKPVSPFVPTLLATFLAAASLEAFTLDDIHFWSGTGPNRAAVVLDWNDGSLSLAWGVRWKGDAPSLADALLAIDREDPRLSLFTESAADGLRLLAAGYDTADSATQFRFTRQDGAVVAESSDSAARVAGGGGAWRHLPLVSSPSERGGAAQPPGGTFRAVLKAEAGDDTLSGTALEDGSWHVLQFVPEGQTPPSPEGQTPASPAAPVAAESPYAFEVVAATFETDRSFNKWFHADTVLGAPARIVPASSYSPAGPVSPVNPAPATNQIVSLVHGYDEDLEVYIPGSITVRFDHPVVDDPLNPYGMDFIVFGNALQVLVGYYTATDNPETVVVKTDQIIAEPGLVEVSQDGQTWFAYTDGPYADDWPPTLGAVYDPENPDASIFDGNVWWGAATDATRPLDPALSAAMFKGQTLAHIVRLYEGSAGGTAFDIGGFNLPADARGRKWIQYVRVTSLTTTEDADWTEVDAFADVSPATPYELWSRAHYGVEARLAGAADRDAVAPNGRTNLENAMLGLAPNEASRAAVRIDGFRMAEGRAEIAVAAPSPIFDMVRVAVSPTPDGAGTAVLPVYEGVDGEGRQRFSVPVDSNSDAAFFKLRLE